MAAQVEAYVRDGFVVSGLIPEPVTAAAAASLWEQIAGPPRPTEKDGWADEACSKYRPLPRDQGS